MPAGSDAAHEGDLDPQLLPRGDEGVELRPVVSGREVDVVSIAVLEIPTIDAGQGCETRKWRGVLRSVEGDGRVMRWGKCVTDRYIPLMKA